MKRLFSKIPSLVHPLLFAMFPILFLYAHNISETSANQVLMPMLFSVAGALVLWVLLSLLLRSTLKAGLATTLLVILFFSYGRLYDVLDKWGLFVPSHGILLPAVLLVWGYCVYFIKLAHRDFRNTTKILNVLAVVLILMNVFSVVVYEVGKPKLSTGGLTQTGDGSTPTGDSTESGTRPDIYYIILDEYAHPDTMAEYYDYDNSQFINYLTNKGFFVALGSKTKTPYSERSIASSLNMQWLPVDTPREVAYQEIADSKVAYFLSSQGYKYVYMGSYFDTGRYRVNADLYYNFYQSSGSSVVSDFYRIFWNTTMLRPFYNHLIGGQYLGYLRQKAIESLEQLKKMPNIEGPKFVFAHLMLPHGPIVFGPDGEYIDPTNWENYQDKQFYRGQYIFTTMQIEGVISALLKQSRTPPIIVIQSDHGLRPASVHPGVQVGSDEWQKILNAYCLPGNGNEDLYESISPVNSFRLIFNLYFDANYDLLPDNGPPQVEFIR